MLGWNFLSDLAEGKELKLPSLLFAPCWLHDLNPYSGHVVVFLAKTIYDDYSFICLVILNKEQIYIERNHA